MTQKRSWLVKIFSILFLMMFLAWTMPSEALARAGGGKSGGGSMGSRGSRSATPVQPYTPPSSSTVRPTTPTPGQPVKPTTPPAMATPAAPTSSLWRSFGGGLVGGLAGGMLANWLFGGSSTAQAATKDGGYKGPGLMDIILLAGIGFLIYWFIRKRRQEAAATQGAYQSSMASTSMQPPYYDQQPSPQTEAERDLQQGLNYIQQLDPLFTEDKFRDQVMDNFFKVQGAWADRDMSSVKHLLTEEMYKLLQDDVTKMRSDGLVNHLEQVAVREVNITEAWQESGMDFITVRLYANLLDYTVDEKTGEVVSGNKTEPVKFEEYWTFSRPVGNNPWHLTAINQAD